MHGFLTVIIMICYHSPFPVQKQTYPDLQKNTKPVPDCGETNYIGDGHLRHRKTLATGGDPGIGRAIAFSCALEGTGCRHQVCTRKTKNVQDVRKLIEETGRKAILNPVICVTNNTRRYDKNSCRKTWQT